MKTDYSILLGFCFGWGVNGGIWLMLSAGSLSWGHVVWSLTTPIAMVAALLFAEKARDAQ